MEDVYTPKQLGCTHRHTHTCIYTEIFGIAASPVTVPLGMANTFIQPSHGCTPVPNTASIPSQHAFFNQLTFISLLCSSMGLYGPFSLHKTHLCSPQPLFGKSRSTFFCREILWCVAVSTGIDVVHENETKFHASRVTGHLLFCILCNSACHLGKIDGGECLRCNKSSKSEITYVQFQHCHLPLSFQPKVSQELGFWTGFHKHQLILTQKVNNKQIRD